MKHSRERQVASPYKNLPEELQQLIEHTDKGVERLYRSAHSTNESRPEQRTAGTRGGGGGRGDGRAGTGVARRRPAPAASLAAPRGRQGARRNEVARPIAYDNDSRSDDYDNNDEGKCNGPYTGDEEDEEEEGRHYDSSGDGYGEVDRRTVSYASSGTREDRLKGRRRPAPPRAAISSHRHHHQEQPVATPTDLSGITGGHPSVSLESLGFQSVPAGRHERQPTCSLVERRRNKNADTSFSPAVTQRPRSGTAAGATTSTTGGSTFLSPDKSRGWSSQEASLLTGGHGPTSMRTRFGQKWSNTFQTLFGPEKDAVPAGGSSNHTPPTALPNNPLTQQPAAVVAPAAAVAAAAVVHPPPAPPAEGPDTTQLNGLLVLRLKDELRDREQAIVKLRLDHALEVAALKEATAAARREGAAEAAERAAAAGAVQAAIAESTLRAEQQRREDTREELVDARKATTAAEELRRATEARAADAERRAAETPALAATVAELQGSLRAAEAERARLEDVTRQQARALTSAGHLEASQRAQVAELEDQLQRQEAAAQETLARLEDEFAATTNSYQQLLTEATVRMGRLEKAQRRHRLLKEEHAAGRAAATAALDAHAAQERGWAEDRARLAGELRSAQEGLAAAQSAVAALTVTHDAALGELQRQSESQRLSTTDRTRLLQSQIETANHTVQLLRTQVENMKSDVTEEQAHGQQLAMRMAETEARLHQEKQEQHRSAAEYRGRSEDTMAALRRQLREKDAQLKTLAASSAEPLQRARAQLEEERGRRAHLEELFAQYKKKAKAAEESAVMEMRRERLRSAAYLTATPRGAGQRSSSTAANSATQATSGRRYGSGSGGGGSGGLSDRTPLAVIEARADRGDGWLGRSDGWPTATAGAPSPPQVQTTVITHEPLPGHRQERQQLPPHPRRGRLDPVDENIDLRAATPPPSAAARGVDSISGIAVDSPCKSASTGGASGRRSTPGAGAAPSHPQSLPSATDASLSVDSGRPRPSAGGLAPALVLNSTTATAATPEPDSGRTPWYQYGASSGAAVKTCPATVATTADSGHRPATPRTAGAFPLMSPPLAAATPAPAWIEQRDERFDGAAITATAADGHPDGDHEQRMHDFHASASQVFQRIAASRDDFMTQCAAIVRQSGAAAVQQRRRVRRSSATGGAAAADHDDSLSNTGDDLGRSEEDDDL